MSEAEGTVVKEVVKVERMLVSGVAADKNVTRISVVGLADKPGVAFRLFDALAKANINVDMILQSIGRDDTKDITFTIPRDMETDALNAIEGLKDTLEMQDIKTNSKVAKVSIVGAGMMSNPGVASKMFECLYNANINIRMISTSEIRVTVLIDEKEVEKAMNVIHDMFGLED